MEKIIVNIDWCEKNFAAIIDKRINGVVCVTNRDLAALKNEINKTLQFHIDGCIKDGDKLPEWLIKRKYEYIYKYTDSALLRIAQKYTTLAAISKASGIKQGQLSHYANATSRPQQAQHERIVAGIKKISKEIAAVV